MSNQSVVEAMHHCIAKVATGPEYSKDLDFDEARQATDYMLSADADPVRSAVTLIALRMKRETQDENKGILQSILDTANIVTADVEEVIDIADPYNGHNRSLPVCAFIPPVLAACGIPAVTHGLETVSPKFGITIRKSLRAAGAKVDLSVTDAAHNIANPDIGWAYVDQSAYCPPLNHLMDLRQRIVKRTVLTTVEVLIGPIRGKSRTHILTGYVHKAYPPVYADLTRFAGFDSAMIVRGVEGGVIPSLQQTAKLFSYHDKQAETQTLLDPGSIGIKQDHRAVPIPAELPAAAKSDIISPTSFDVEAAATKTAELGIAALQGKAGITYDSLLYSAAIVLNHLGRANTLESAAKQVRKVLDSGEAYTRFTAS